MHCFLIASTTKSGVKVPFWLEQEVHILILEGKSDCPALCNEEGFLLSEATVESVLHWALEEIKESGSNLVPRVIDIQENYHCFHLSCQGAEIQAWNNGISLTTIEFVHHWNRFEYNRG